MRRNQALSHGEELCHVSQSNSGIVNYQLWNTGHARALPVGTDTCHCVKQGRGPGIPPASSSSCILLGKQPGWQQHSSGRVGWWHTHWDGGQEGTGGNKDSRLVQSSGGDIVPGSNHEGCRKVAGGSAGSPSTGISPGMEQDSSLRTGSALWVEKHSSLWMEQPWGRSSTELWYGARLIPRDRLTPGMELGLATVTAQTWGLPAAP